MNKLAFTWFTCITSLFVVPSISLAAPSVSGSTVTWPSDGWYQVQRSDTFATVCEGRVASESGNSGGSCIIGSGSYIVINHSTGERFESVTAVSTSTNANSIVVDGPTISWPDDGWYQVQDASDYQSVCEGGTSCTVQAGNYVLTMG